MDLSDFVQGQSYPEEVRNAVLYGYEFRSALEEASYDGNCEFSLAIPEPSESILFLANAIFSGIAYDAFKLLVEAVMRYFKTRKRRCADEVQTLNNPQDSRRFYEYIKEYKERRMIIPRVHAKYIYEAVVADYSEKESLRIYQSEGRFPTQEESSRIQEEAHRAASIILSDRHYSSNEDGQESV